MSELNLYRTLAAFVGHAWTASRLSERLGEYSRSLGALDQFIKDGWSLANASEFLVGLLRSRFDLETVEVQKEEEARVSHPADVDHGTLLLPPGSGERQEVRIPLPQSRQEIRLVPSARSGGLHNNAALRVWLFTLDTTLALTSLQAGAREAVHVMTRGLADLAARVDPATTTLSEQAVALVHRLCELLRLPAAALEDLVLATRLTTLVPAFGLQQGAASVLPRTGGWEAISRTLRCQQERWDGGGPLGLRGEEIPLEARVLAVISRFLGLCDDLDQQKDLVIAVMEQESGKLLDPDLVSMLIRELLPACPDLKSMALPDGPTPPAKARDRERRSAAARFRLTAREIEILDLMALCLSNREIAASLFVSEATVKTHVSRILRKTGTGRRSKAVRVYLEFIQN